MKKSNFNRSTAFNIAAGFGAFITVTYLFLIATGVIKL